MQNFLGLFIKSASEEDEKTSLQTLIDEFDVHNISLGGPVFDTSKLDWLNGRYLREELSVSEFLDAVKAWALNDSYLTPIAEMAQARITKMSDLGGLTAMFFMNRIEGMTLERLRDGVKLAGNLYLPQGKGPFPCIVVRTPYGKDEMYKDPRGAEGYQKSGYAYLVQDTRGKGHSEGFYQAFVNDRDDGYDTIEWMAKQSWCTGKVGMFGISWGGFNALQVAARAQFFVEAGAVGAQPHPLDAHGASVVQQRAHQLDLAAVAARQLAHRALQVGGALHGAVGAHVVEPAGGATAGCAVAHKPGAGRGRDKAGATDYLSVSPQHRRPI